jgi:predicted acetyltransferase
MGRFVARLRSPDDPIFEVLEGPRRASALVHDGLWVRVMDVPAALEARSYSADFRGVVRVIDDMGIADGTFRLDLGAEGAKVQPSRDEPDIVLDVHDLGSIYLGRPGLARKARAGRVSGDRALLRDADRAFNWDPQPWCPEIF